MKKTQLGFFGILLIVGLVVLGAIPAHAQTSESTGALQGIVKDPNGAVIQGAKVTLINTALSLHREIMTQSDGGYVFPLLQPGNGYEVDVEQPGFEQAVDTNLTVRVTETTTANIQLKLGSVSERVVVTGAAETVQTSNATLGGTLTKDVIMDLPLATRDVLDLLGTDAGVGATLTSPAATILQGAEALFVGGGRDTANNYVVNGVDSNNFEFHTLSMGIVPVPNPDAVQEFRTETSLYDASSGFSGGGNINLVTRSGTQNYHGALYEYFRNTIFNANDFFLNEAGKARPVMIQNQFGGSLGGPVPHLSKTFWFFNYEAFRQRNGSAGAVTLPAEIPVLPATRDRATLEALYQLPPGSIDQVALNILNAKGPYGGFLFPSGTGAETGALGTFAFSAPVHLTGNQYNGRLDHEFKLGGVANNLGVVYFANPDQFFNTGGANGTVGQPYQYILMNNTFSIHDTQTFRPNLLNEITAGFTYNQRDIQNVNPVTVQDIGMTRFNQDLVGGTPNLIFDDGLSCCGASASVGETQHNESANFRDIVTYIRGKHSFRAGFEVLTQQFNFGVPLDRGTLEFATGQFGSPSNSDQIYGAPTDPNLDIAFRDFLIGSPEATSISSGLTKSDFRAHNFGSFIQDDYRATRRLTLNLGVRWDYFGNVTATNDLLSNLVPSRIDPTTAMTGGPGLQAGFILPAGAPGGFGTPGVSKSTLNHQYAHFSPRLGFAYDVFGNGKMAVRGGFGMYYMRIGGLEGLQSISNPPFSLSTETLNLINPQPNLLSNPFPTLPLPSAFPQFPAASFWPTLQSINPVTGAPNFSTSQVFGTEFDPNSKSPYTEQYNLATQYEFLPGWTVEVGYLGTRGVHLQIGQSINNALLRNDNNPALANSGIPGVPAGGWTTNAFDNNEIRVPVVGFCSGCIQDYATHGKSFYNAALLTVSHQFKKGLFLKAAYTFAKDLDNAPTSIGFEPGAQGSGNQYLPDLNYGLSDYDIRHRLVVTYVYYLPGPHEGVLKTAFGNWAVSGLTTLQSGFAGEIDNAGNFGTLSGTGGYGVVLPNCQLMTGHTPSDNNGPYLNSSCVEGQPALAPGTVFSGFSPFEGPGNQTYTITPGSQFGGGTLAGISTRGAFRNPFQNRWDMSLIKKFPWSKLGDSGNIEFEAQAFKLFNTPVFAPLAFPSNYAGEPAFGQIFSSTDKTGRQFQFALRLNF